MASTAPGATFTSPLSTTSSKSPEQLFSHVVGEARKPSKREKSSQITKEHKDMLSIMKTLNDLGIPLEKALTAAVGRAVVSLESQGDEGRKMIGELRVLEKEWKEANRFHLKRAKTFLERNGVISLGVVEVPGDPIVLD
jgi:hypothetical protein